MAVGDLFKVAGMSMQLCLSATGVIGLAQFELLPITVFPLFPPQHSCCQCQRKMTLNAASKAVMVK